MLLQEHHRSERLFVEDVGDTLPVTTPVTSEQRSAALIVAVLGPTNYTFAEATWAQSLPYWIGSHLRAFELLGGVPAIAVPDNLKAGTTRACRYEPEPSRTYEGMAARYGVAIIPARRRKLRDQAKVEVGTLVLEHWTMAALRKRQFFSLRARNAAIAELLTRLNDRPFRKADSTRHNWFLALDQPALRQVPAERYEHGDWGSARVNIAYHVAISTACITLSRRSLFRDAPRPPRSRGIRVASHPRSRAPNKATTVNEHRPKPHHRCLQWTSSRMIEWGRAIGPLTAELVVRVLGSKGHPEQGFRSCLGIILRGETYGAERDEAAARRALNHGMNSSKSLRRSLKRASTVRQIHLLNLPNRHPITRTSVAPTTSTYPTRRSRCAEPTNDRQTLHHARHGRSPATADAKAGYPSTNFRGTARLAESSQVGMAAKPGTGAQPAERPAKGQACVEDVDYRTPRGLDRAMQRSPTQKLNLVAEHQNLFLLGPTNIGKRWLARAIGQKVCRDGYTALFPNAPKLQRESMVARADGSHAKYLSQLSRVDVLIVDDWAMAPLGDGERRDFLDVCDERYQMRSTMLTNHLRGIDMAWADRGLDSGPAGASDAPDRITEEIMRQRRGKKGGQGMSTGRGCGCFY